MQTQESNKVIAAERFVKLVIKYPQVVVETQHVTVTEEAWEAIQNMSLDEQADFICREIEETDIQWIPGGKQGLVGALDMGYSSIKIDTKPSSLSSTTTTP